MLETLVLLGSLRCADCLRQLPLKKGGLGLARFSLALPIPRLPSTTLTWHTHMAPDSGTVDTALHHPCAALVSWPGPAGHGFS